MITTKQAIQMRKMREDGATYREIGERFNMNQQYAKLVIYRSSVINEDDAFLLEIENECVASRLAREGIHTKEDLYALVEKHGYIKYIGKTALEYINAKVDRKICLMPSQNIIVNHGYYSFNRTVTPLQFKDEATKKKKKSKWIPCSERLPKDVELGEEYPTVIFCNSKGTVYVGFCEYSIYGIRWWNTTDWEDVVDNVIAWMPLPEPYKERRADDSF